MKSFKTKSRQIIKCIVKPVYYLPYNIRLLIKGRKQELVLPDAELIKNLFEGMERNIVGVVSTYKRIGEVKKGVCELGVDKYFVKWICIDEIQKDLTCDNLYILFELFEYTSMTRLLHEKGLRDGKEFILLLDGGRYIENYQGTSKQRNWVEVENVRRMSKQDWINRIVLMKDLIGTKNRSVLDIGCWECELKEYLGNDITYYGCDYVKRQKDTIVCDLNHYEFPNIDFDVAYISGSLEYMENLEWYFDQICKANHEVILSYSLLEYFPLIDLRKRKSWVNHLSAIDIIEYMKRRNFLLTTSEFWGKWTVIFKFERKNVV